MKCDELRIENDCVYGPDAKVYLAEQVDEAIAELKQKLHDAEMQADLAECAVTEYKIDYDKLKSEADKVIADLEESHKKEVEQLLMEIAELKADYKEACDRLQTANLIKDEQLAATRHHKYKRCLAMASYWVAVSYQCVDDKCRQRAEKHHYKWLELAERFKEAK